jgi:hypothetical protein
MNELLKTKTFWTGIAGIVAAVGGYLTGTMSPAEAIQTGIGSLVAIFLRDGLRKK